MDITEKLLYILLTFLVQLLLVYKIKSRKNRKNIFGRHVVVTGGTSGIGLRIAIECVLKGAHVTVIARNIQLLEKTVELLKLKKINPKQKISYRSLDISRNYSEIENVLSDVEKTMGPIFMLVNCAGLAICGTVEDVSVDDARKLMDVNYYGTYYCTRYVLPKMKNAGEGIIVMTASQAALFGIYGYGPYAATKFAIRGLAETIAMEAKHKGVSVTLALPSDTDTPGFENEEKTKPKETKIISGSGGLANPEEVGKQILEDALRGSFFSILGFESWIITILCCGMAPWGGIGLNLLQALLMGPLRIIGIGLQWHFSRIIKRCEKEKNNKEIQVSLCNCKFLPKITFEVDEIDCQSGNESIEIMSKSGLEKTITNEIEIKDNLLTTTKSVNLNSSKHDLLSLSNIEEENEDHEENDNMNRSFYQSFIKTITPNLKWYLDKAIKCMKKTDYIAANTKTFNEKLTINTELSSSPSSSLNSNSNNLISTADEMACNVKPSIIKKLVKTQTHKSKNLIDSHTKTERNNKNHKSDFLNPLKSKQKEESDKFNDTILQPNFYTGESFDLNDDTSDDMINFDNEIENFLNMDAEKMNNDKIEFENLSENHKNDTPYLTKVDISTKKLCFEFKRNSITDKENNQKLSNLNNANEKNKQKNSSTYKNNKDNDNNLTDLNQNELMKCDKNFQLNNFCNVTDQNDVDKTDSTPLTTVPFYENNDNTNKISNDDNIDINSINNKRIIRKAKRRIRKPSQTHIYD